MSKQFVLRPRNDFVLVKEEMIGVVAGLFMPEVSAEGKKHVVQAIGSKVEDLKVGDVVKIGGQEGLHYYYVPNFPGMLVIRQEMVVLVLDEVVKPVESAYEEYHAGHE